MRAHGKLLVYVKRTNTGAKDIANKQLILLYYFKFGAKANALKAKKIDFRH
jgi:hypothetical protein